MRKLLLALLLWAVPLQAAVVAPDAIVNQEGVLRTEWYDLDVSASPSCVVTITQTSQLYVFLRGADATGGTCTAWWRARESGSDTGDDVRLEFVLSTNAAATAPSVDLAAAAFTDGTIGSYAVAVINAHIPILLAPGQITFTFATTGGGPWPVFVAITVPVIH